MKGAKWVLTLQAMDDWGAGNPLQSVTPYRGTIGRWLGHTYHVRRDGMVTGFTM